MITTRSEEILSGIVSMDNFVLGSIENCTVNRQHGNYRNYLLHALVSEKTEGGSEKQKDRYVESRAKQTDLQIDSRQEELTFLQQLSP